MRMTAGTRVSLFLLGLVLLGGSVFAFPQSPVPQGASQVAGDEDPILEGCEAVDNNFEGECPPLDLEGPGFFDEAEGAMLEEAGAGNLDKITFLTEEIPKDPECPTAEVLELKLQLEDFWKELRGAMLEKFRAVVGFAVEKDQPIPKEELEFLKVELDKLQARYAAWYAELWSVPEGQNPETSRGSLLKWIPNTQTGVAPVSWSGVAPVSWTPSDLGERSSRWGVHTGRMRRSFGGGWWSWSGLGASLRSCLGSSSRRRRRLATGCGRRIWTRGVAATG